MQQPTLNSGDRFYSPGGNYEYEVIGAVCPLFDRELLPYPCCNLGWRGKQPSWNRRGRRLIPDIATKKCENYSVKLLYFVNRSPIIWSFTYLNMGENLVKWWIDTTQRESSVDWCLSLSNYQQLTETKELIYV